MCCLVCLFFLIHLLLLFPPEERVLNFLLMFSERESESDLVALLSAVEGYIEAKVVKNYYYEIECVKRLMWAVVA